MQDGKYSQGDDVSLHIVSGPFWSLFLGKLFPPVYVMVQAGDRG